MLKTLFACSLLLLPLSAYEKPDSISDDGWEEIQPYLVDETSSLKKKLDKIFSPKKRPSRSPITLKLAGFEIIRGNPRNGMISAKHPKLKGKVIKIFPDDNAFGNDWFNFLTRVKGAEFIRELIRHHEWEEDFAVPNKEIYVLPADDFAPIDNFPKKHFALVVDEVKMHSYETHLLLWKSHLITEDKINKLFILILEGGLIDSVYIDNIPLNKKGKITFVDTEHFQKNPIPFSRFDQFLNPAMQSYWQRLTGR